jgi:hypothetical protein
MDQLIPTLAPLVAAFADCFRSEVFRTFQAVVAAWIVCPGPHTLSEVWQATGLAARRHHDLIYALFHSAVWDWDDLAKILVTLLLAHLVPRGVVWVVADDTLAHKRGARVALGGFFLDAVTSSKRRKNFRFGVNWVVVGLAVHLPFRPDRYFCLPVLWRAYRKKGQPGHRKRTALAADLVRVLAHSFPQRSFWLVADAAYLNATLLADRPPNVQILGPIRWDAALFALPPPRRPGQKGAPRKRGERLPTPRQMLADTEQYPAEVATVAFARERRPLRIQVIRDVLWYHACKSQPVALVLVRDVQGHWRDTALVATDAAVSAAFVIQGYSRRWSIEVAFYESKQYLGLHDPQVRCERSVERAHPMAWFVGSLTILWYAVAGRDGPEVRRERPWYRSKPHPTFTDMLGALRLQQWRRRLLELSGDEPPFPEVLENLIHYVAAVR